jgi:hypothetical protein
MYTRMEREKSQSKLLNYLDKYKAHYTIGAFVYLSFAISGFQFDIAESSTLTRLAYGFLQVFLLILFLSLSKELIQRRFPNIRNIVVLNILVILLGTFGSFFFDYILIELFKFIDPNCIFQESNLTNNEFTSYLKFYFGSFLEDLKYPVLFWPLCELAQSYLSKLTQSIKTEFVLTKSSFEDLPFLKDIPKSERKNLLAIEAQQNYIQLIYPEKNYTVLYRLKDALIQIPTELGMKVHRSYWVSFSAIDKQKDALTIILVNGREVPVSRSFSKELKAKL